MLIKISLHRKFSLFVHEHTCAKLPLHKHTNKHIHTSIKNRRQVNLNTDRQIHTRKQVFDSLIIWVFLFLAKISIGCNCTTWVAAGVSSGGHLLCFNFTVGMNVHQSSSLCSLCSFTGEIFLRKGTIGPAERNISTTTKIIEHVTDSYHIV